MSNGRKVESYTYRLVDEGRIGTPAGEFDTLHFERVTSEPNDRHVEVWLAKDAPLLPRAHGVRRSARASASSRRSWRCRRD